MPDKSKELNASIVLINDRVNFQGTADSKPPVLIDYTPPVGDNLGYTSLELFLLSISSCLGTSVLTFLRRMKKTISAFSIDSKGFRKEEHPTGFREIHILIKLRSPDAAPEDLDKVIKMSEETYCPVLSMIKGNVNVMIRYEITS